MNAQNNKHLGDEHPSRYQAVFRFLFTWFLIIVVFVIIFSRIQFTDVINIIKQTDIRFLCVAIIFSFFAHVIFSSARYQKVVESLGCRISFFESMIIRMGCNPIKGVLPFKTGELTIIAYMKNKHNLSYPEGLFSVFFGYIFSLIVLMIIYSCGGFFYFQHPFQEVIFAVLFLLVMLFIIPSNVRKIPFFIDWYVSKFRKQQAVPDFLNEKIDFRIIHNIIFCSLGIEGSKLLIIFAVLKSFHITIPVEALLLLGSITIIAVYLPITYWGLGVREPAILFLFSGYAASEHLLAGSLLITFIDGMLPVLLGLLFMKPFLKGLLGKEKAGGEGV